MSVTDATRAIPARLKTLPPFPPVAARLLTVLAQPAEGLQVKNIATLIESDPTFSARLLQQANSMEFSVATPIDNIRHALVILGFERTRQTTVTLAMAAYSKVALRAPELRQCWRHTIATAVLADGISRRVGAFVESAYTAGLMHDVGRLGLLVAYPQEYEATIRDAASRCLDLIDFERETFGLDHQEIGRWLAEKWRLPDELRVIAGRHHDPCEGVEISLLRIVHTACNLADALGYFVTKPLNELNVKQVLKELPEQPRKAILAEVSQLRARVEAKIAEFDSEGQPELAPIAAIGIQDTEPEDSSFVIELPLKETVTDEEPSPTFWSRILALLFSWFNAPRPEGAAGEQSEPETESETASA